MTLPTAAFFLGFLALAACERTETDNPQPAKPTVRLCFEGAQPVAEDEAATRTQWTGSGLSWSAGDAIQIAYSINGSWNSAMFISDPLSEAAGTANFTVDAGWEMVSGSYAFRTVYPAAAASNYNAGNGTVQVNIPAAQTPAKPGGTLSFDPAADLLWGSSTQSYNALPEGTPVPIDWKRKVAHADITLNNLPSAIASETVTKVILRAQDGAALAGSYSLNLGTGAMTPVETTETIVLSAANLSLSGSSLELWAALSPVTVTQLTVTVETDRARYTRSVSDLNLQFMQNRRNTLGVNMSSAVRTEFAYTLVSETPDDWSGDYLMAYDNHVLAGKAEGGNYGTYQDLTVTDGKISYSAGKAYNLKIAKRSSGHYSLQYGTQYLGYANSGNTLTFNENPGDNWGAFEWSFTLDGTAVQIQNAGTTERYLQWNNATNALRFACYTGGQKTPSLYRLNRDVEADDPVTPPDPPVPPTPPDPSNMPGYLGCIEVPALTTLTGASQKGSYPNRDDVWYRYYTSDANRQVASHTYTHPTYKRQTRNYTVLFDGTRFAPVWAAFAMHSDMWPDNNNGRGSGWRDDSAIDLPQQNGISGSYSRGHLVASNYRQTAEGQNDQTFYHTNQAPQWQTGFNDGVWNQLEQAVQSHMPSGRDTLYVVVGLLYEGTIKYMESNNGKNVPIPSHFYKCLMKCSFDTSGAMTAAKGVAYIFTNEGHKGMKYSDGVTTIDAIEERAGFDFFPRVPEALQTTAEASTTQLW